MIELDRLREKWSRMQDLDAVQQFLEWDQQVLMPRQGAEQRSREIAALAGAVHGALIDPELRDLIGAVSDRAQELDLDGQADLREAKRAVERATRLPSTLVAERARACSLAQNAWEEARQKCDFAAFRPHLAEVIRLTRAKAAALGTPNPYNALLDEYEPGMTEEALRPLFVDLRRRLVPLLRRIQSSPHQPSSNLLHRHFPRDLQESFGRLVLQDMGFDFSAGRLDTSVHPFTSGTFGDVRITTRYDEGFLSTSLFGIIHEAGHALYEQGLDPVRYTCPAGQACSLGVHESQSRFWENLIGRSRPFWARYLPTVQRAFPGVLDDVALDELYQAINVCTPSLIRVEADEVTYNLHIILRFELECSLLHGDLEVKDLRAAWNEQLRALLDIPPTTDREGVLQDVHWAAGLFGYFPTYTLGNLFAAQLMAQLRREVPLLDKQIERGELLPVKHWLNRNIHVQGRRLLAPDLCRQVTGQAPDAAATVEYLENKYGEIYRL